MMHDGWTCLSPGPEHVVDLEQVSRLPHCGPSAFTVDRCRTCGQLYRYTYSEVNDWSGENDYVDQTYIWQVLDPDELEAATTDINYRPRNQLMHRYDSGWH